MYILPCWCRGYEGVEGKEVRRWKDAHEVQRAFDMPEGYPPWGVRGGVEPEGLLAAEQHVEVVVVVVVQPARRPLGAGARFRCGIRCAIGEAWVVYTIHFAIFTTYLPAPHPEVHILRDQVAEKHGAEGEVPPELRHGARHDGRPVVGPQLQLLCGV